MRVAVIIVTRNNPVLLEHAVSNFLKYKPGVDCDYLIMDGTSDNPRQKSFLQKQKLGWVVYSRNDRVEQNFHLGWKVLKDKNYDFYFFCHDDNVPIEDNWLLPFVERAKSSYFESDCPEEYQKLPIGRVGALSQFWRSYEDVRGYPVACPFLKPCIETVLNEPAPAKFKYADCDRVLVSKECLEATEGLVTLTSFEQYHKDIAFIFDKYLHYPDEGMYPIEKYPPGLYWNKKTLLSEFMNSVLPLMRGFRTVGVDSEGYLEQIHGDDEPWANRYIAHYGGPNSVKALGKLFGTDHLTIKRKLNDPVLLAKAHRYFRSYYAEQRSISEANHI